ncbi:MAG TPA: potassium channel family protein [Phnomibacter sp.]|nr:potassium channel family protein [Phnomibacter sp.]
MRTIVHRFRNFWMGDVSFISLLFILGFIVFILPVLLSNDLIEHIWVDIALVTLYFIGIFSAGTRRLMIIATFMFAIHIVLKVVRYGNTPYEFFFFENLIASLNVMIFIYLNFQLLFRDQNFNVYRIVGAVNIYLLFALLGTFGFQMIHIWTGNSLRGSVSLTHTQKDISEFLYFSMVSLTTVGYGDIYPANPASRMLAVFISAIGILFPAVIIARLVGLAGSEKAPAKDK